MEAISAGESGRAKLGSHARHDPAHQVHRACSAMRSAEKPSASKFPLRPSRDCCRGARWSSRIRTSRRAISSRPSSRPTSARFTTAARPSEYRNPQRILQPHLSDRRPELATGWRRQTAVGQQAAIRLSSCKPISAAARRTRCWPSTIWRAERRYRICPVSTSFSRSSGLSVPAKVNRAVLVGTSRGPQDVLQAEGGSPDPDDLG